MTIEGAIADLQNLIDSEGIPFWAKPSLQKVMETVEAERERYIEERKTNDVLDKIRAVINSPNRGTCDYFIVDRIEEIINEYKAESKE